MAKRRGKYFYRAQFQQDETGAFRMPDADGRVLGTADAWHRCNVEHSPYCIPNELICATIGRFLGLPIPPFAITYFDKSPVFTSLNFNHVTGDLPPIDPQVCAERFPRICTGILFFDILIANEDRHDENLAVDNIANPRQIVVYDHDQALFGGCKLQGIDRLAALQDRPGITGGEVTGGNECCLLRAINTTEYFNEWRIRICDIPGWFIDETCNSAVRLGITQQEANRAKRFLEYRKSRIVQILKSCGTDIAVINEWNPPNVLFDK